ASARRLPSGPTTAQPTGTSPMSAARRASRTAFCIQNSSIGLRVYPKNAKFLHPFRQNVKHRYSKKFLPPSSQNRKPVMNDDVRSGSQPVDDIHITNVPQSFRAFAEEVHKRTEKPRTTPLNIAQKLLPAEFNM